MLKKQRNALMRIARRGEVHRGQAYGFFHGTDRHFREWHMVTDGYVMVGYPSKEDLDDELLPHLELPVDGFAEQLTNWTELEFDCAVPSAMPKREPPMDNLYKRMLELTKEAKRNRANGPMEWETIQDNRGWFDPVLVFDALEAIGHNASVFIGVAGERRKYPVLAIYPEDRYPGDGWRSPVAIVLPVCDSKKEENKHGKQ